jgi:hypothetical protein
VNRRAQGGEAGGRVDRVATLVRFVPVRLVEVSRAGCQLECSRRLESGTSGLLSLELAGSLLVDDVRIVRCQPRIGAGSVYQVGAELLKTRRLGHRTIRMAVGRLVDTERGGSYPSLHAGMTLPRRSRPGEVRDKSVGRAPPALPDRGS